ncbi:MAG: hypothetical protein IT423_24495 [Pirellulaceae bacterium]|nr:hypothetical protein [Pirellulaceae bacterium]
MIKPQELLVLIRNWGVLCFTIIVFIILVNLSVNVSRLTHSPWVLTLRELMAVLAFLLVLLFSLAAQDSRSKRATAQSTGSGAPSLVAQILELIRAILGLLLVWVNKKTARDK